MNPAATQLWYIVIATCALAGWWLAVRPNASYRGASGTMSVLIVLMAILLSILAWRGAQRPRALPSAYALAAAGHPPAALAQQGRPLSRRP